MTTTTIKMPAGDFEQAAGVFALLSRLWAKEVDSKTLNNMTQPPFANAWKEAGGNLPSQVSAELIDELAVDYCQLLIGPKNHVSPVQSVWDQARFQAEATESMQKYLQMIDGFQPCVDFVDHIAVQLQFASALFSMADQSQRKLIQGLGVAFCRDHLEWSESFFRRIEQQAETEFYKSLAQVSRQFLFGAARRRRRESP